MASAPLNPGRIAAYATLPDGFVKPGGQRPSGPPGGSFWVVPVGEPGLICDRNAVRECGVDPPEARQSFPRRHGYDPADRDRHPRKTNPFGDSLCEFHARNPPEGSEDERRPRAPVALTPV